MKVHPQRGKRHCARWPAALCLTVAGACTPTVEHRGYLPQQKQMALLQIGMPKPGSRSHSRLAVDNSHGQSAWRQLFTTSPALCISRRSLNPRKSIARSLRCDLMSSTRSPALRNTAWRTARLSISATGVHRLAERNLSILQQAVLQYRQVRTSGTERTADENLIRQSLNKEKPRAGCPTRGF